MARFEIFDTRSGCRASGQLFATRGRAQAKADALAYHYGAPVYAVRESNAKHETPTAKAMPFSWLRLRRAS